ncbi:TBCC-domain-containing protein [Calocera viscosa TUFC12733]|uniref:TBCC-domain-containing protein n=1 Tax=Calocera viscosa (strain TUFC12733) TaxID=1330018 RepID=A0A167KHY5_CALVF|nr:TBCC-domain-containing protein [Calocera viscosa TUFC12733]
MAEQRALGEQFIAQFKERKAGIEEELASVKSGPNIEQNAQTYDTLQTQIMTLRADLTTVMTLLTSYDQRQLDVQLKALEQQLREAKTVAKPQGKFSFKRSKAPTKAPTPPIPNPSPSDTTLVQTASSSLPPNYSSGETISSLSNTCVTSSSIYSNDGGDILLSSLRSCLVNLIPTSSDPGPPKYGAIHARSLQHTVLLLPHISGSVFLEDCNECLVVVGCHQFRMHSSSNTAVLMNVSSVPIIEHCSGIAIGAYPKALETDHGDGPSLDSKHAEMQDFNWLQPGQSPNWTSISSESASSFEERVRRLMQVPPGPIVDGVLGL